MTRQLDPTILRFFTVSRHISPASEMCLCKFHIKNEYFLRWRHPPCAQTLSALRFLHRHSPIPPHHPQFPTFHHHFPLRPTRIFKSQHFTVSHICVRIFRDFRPTPITAKSQYIPICIYPYFALWISLRKGGARTFICTTDFPCFLSFSFYLHICPCFVRFFKVLSKCPIHSFIFFHMVFRIRSFINPVYGLGRLQNGFHRRTSGLCSIFMAVSLISVWWLSVSVL